MKIVTVVGARPQFVKASVVSRAITEYNKLIADPLSLVSEIILHTGQHFDRNMSAIFFKELDIPKPDYNLGINDANHGAMTGRMLERIEEVLIKEKPDWVLVYGDTNSTLAGALAAAKLHIPLAHVEAGLRSFNMGMPEEINRILTDRISNLLFCPSESAVGNLKKEGFPNIIDDGKLIEEHFNARCLAGKSSAAVNVGDVMYDSTIFNLDRAQKQSTILNDLGLIIGDSIKPFYLATVHREENTDDVHSLKEILEAFKELSKEVTIVRPLHPRTRAKINELDSSVLTGNAALMIADPVPYLDMMVLEKYAKLILTDSGGVQKEAYF